MTGARRADLLWSPLQRTVGAAAVLLSVVGLGICWWGVSGERTFDAQENWLIGAVVSAAVVLAGLAYLLLAGSRQLRELRDEVRARTLSLLH